MKNTVQSSNEAAIGVFNHTASIKVHQNNFSSFKHSYQIYEKNREILILMIKIILKYQYFSTFLKKELSVQWNLDLRKPDLRKNLDLRKIVGTTDFLVHKLFDLRKIF